MEPIHAPHGTTLTCKSWQLEAPMRMLMNNLDPEVAERPEDLVVYGGKGKAARNWQAYADIIATLQSMDVDDTLVVQSGKPVAVWKTHIDAPRVIISNSMLVPHWATWDEFHKLEDKGLIMYGQMTAGSWIYIGAQGILQGTYETLAAAARAGRLGRPERTVRPHGWMRRHERRTTSGHHHERRCRTDRRMRSRPHPEASRH